VSNYANLEMSVSDNPNGLTALKNLHNSLMENAKFVGVGSLTWQLKEYDISNVDTTTYVMKPERRHLVPAFIEVVGPSVLAQTKRELVRQFVLQREYKSHNAVLILHGLAAKGDKAAVAIFTSEEYAALLSVPDDYERGRQVLSSLGLLPEASNARPFKPVPEIKAFIAYMLDNRRGLSEADARLEGLVENDKFAILLALAFLRAHLVCANVRQIFGKESEALVRQIHADPTLKGMVEQVGKIETALAAMAAGTPVDFVIAHLG
jgi:hypothetical protein